MKYISLKELNRQAEVAISRLYDLIEDRKIQNSPRGNEEIRCLLYENSTDIEWEVDLNGNYYATVTPMIRVSNT